MYLYVLYCFAVVFLYLAFILQADTQIRQLTLLDIDSDSVKLFSPTILLEQRQDTPQSNDLPPTSSPQHASLPELPKGSQAEQFSYLKELLGRHSMRHYWDPNEPKILVVESVTQSSQAVGDGLVIKKSSSFGIAGKGRKRKYSQVKSCIQLTLLDSSEVYLISVTLTLTSCCIFYMWSKCYYCILHVLFKLFCITKEHSLLAHS